VFSDSPVSSSCRRLLLEASPEVVSRARELERMGLRGLDALHVASAEAGGAQLLVTTDDRMLRRARRAGDRVRTIVVTPVEGLARLLGERRR
jgi:predicted nucleic acid-binding protein